jgi:hypothetical protein
MPKLQTTPSTNSDAAIAASAARTSVLVTNESVWPCRWSFGTTYVDADSQLLSGGESLNIEGAAAQSAVSFYGLANTAALSITLV